MSRYTKQHYEDVARILRQHIHLPLNIEQRKLAEDFADLFAADNPPTCIDCGARPGEADPEGKCEGHLPAYGFNRDRFLAACGLEPEHYHLAQPGDHQFEGKAEDCPLCGKPSKDSEVHSDCAHEEQARADR